MSCNFRIVVSIFKTQPLEPSIKYFKDDKIFTCLSRLGEL